MELSGFDFSPSQPSSWLSQWILVSTPGVRFGCGRFGCLGEGSADDDDDDDDAKSCR